MLSLWQSYFIGFSKVKKQRATVIGFILNFDSGVDSSYYVFHCSLGLVLQKPGPVKGGVGFLITPDQSVFDMFSDIAAGN